ncbi:MAG: hypothetical protein ACLFQJ_08105 [Campylobacterales bacterium]
MKLTSKLMLTLSIGVVQALVSGCGSSSSSSSSANIDGFVSNGYWKGAKVCVDRDDNQQCDSGEPTATTGDKGVFSISATTGDVGEYAIIAEVVSGETVEVDENGNATGNPIILDKMISPKELQGAITPYTYVVYKEIKENSKSFDDAVAAIGISKEDLLKDYNTEPTLSKMKTGARTISQDIKDGKSLDSIAKTIKDDYSPNPDPTPTTDSGSLSISAE